MRSGRRPSAGGRRLFLGALYWLAVLLVSLALVTVLLLVLEARDASQLEGSGAAAVPAMPAGVAAGASAFLPAPPAVPAMR